MVIGPADINMKLKGQQGIYFNHLKRGPLAGTLERLHHPRLLIKSGNMILSASQNLLNIRMSITGYWQP